MKGKMANIKLRSLLLLFLITLAAAYVIRGSGSQSELHRLRVFLPLGPTKALHLKAASERIMRRNSRRLMIGSTAPICTYNECRGCKYRCKAEQVPVEGNDPINSAYHYRCVCHR